MLFEKCFPSNMDTPVSVPYFRFSLARVAPNVLMAAILAGMLAFQANAATFTVDMVGDVGVSTCSGAPMDCDLRGAIAAANAAGGVDTIDFDAGVFATPQTIILSGTELLITSTGTLTITGTGAVNLTVSGNSMSRVFSNAGTNTTISGLTVSGGTGAGANTTGFGGGVFNSGTLTLDAVEVTGNTTSASGNGGGVYNLGGATLTVNNSTIYNNTGSTGGGGILNFSGATAFVNNSTISGNSVPLASNGGGGIANVGTLTADSITVASNMSPASPGGGVRNFATFTSQNSIYGDNTASSDADFSGTITSNDFNLIEDTTGTTISLFDPQPINNRGSSKGKNRLAANDITGVDPMLGALADYGGPTRTHLLLYGSPAVDFGNSALMTDQRGFTRPIDIALAMNGAGNASDIGAVERLAPTAATVTVSGKVMTASGRGIGNAIVNATDQNGNVISARTNPFGYYRFSNVVAGQDLIFNVFSKQYDFNPRVEGIFGDRSDINFIAQ